MAGNTPIIEVQHITKRFKGLTAVKDVSYSIKEGAITGMIGPNGAGKSTTFNMICGYYPPTEGRIFFRGQDITDKKAYDYTKMKIARTFQIMKPLKNLSVLENVVASCYFGHAAAKSEHTSTLMRNPIAPSGKMPSPIWLRKWQKKPSNIKNNQ